MQNSLNSYSEKLLSCQVCFDEGHLPRLPCGCYFCANCISSWTEHQIRELQFQDKSTVVCLLECCKKTFMPSDILPSLSYDHQQRITEALTRSYLLKTDDIRLCPRPKCTYAGVFRPKSKCRSTLKCELCNKQWREKVHCSLLEDVVNLLPSNKLQKSTFLSNVWEEVFTNKCPKCSISIFKTGGCHHMTCKKCDYEFCWRCLHDYKSHDKRLCFFTNLSKMMIIASMLLSIATFSGLATFLKTIVCTFMIFMFDLVFCDTVLMIMGGIVF
jgi:ariadne-1